MATLIEDQPRRGFWKCHKLLLPQRKPRNHQRLYRVYCTMKLNFHRPAKRRLPKQSRVSLFAPKLPGTLWSAYFVSDMLFNDLHFRTSNMVDGFNREAIQNEFDRSSTSARLLRGLDHLLQQNRLPLVLRTHKEFESRGEAYTRWTKSVDMAIHYF